MEFQLFKYSVAYMLVENYSKNLKNCILYTLVSYFISHVANFDVRPNTSGFNTLNFLNF